MDIYLKWVDAKKDYFEDCVSDMFGDWEVNINKSAAHIALIEIEKSGSILVMVLGDDTWGDMGYDICFKDGVIVNEGAGDTCISQSHQVVRFAHCDAPYVNR